MPLLPRLSGWSEMYVFHGLSYRVGGGFDGVGEDGFTLTGNGGGIWAAFPFVSAAIGKSLSSVMDASSARRWASQVVISSSFIASDTPLSSDSGKRVFRTVAMMFWKIC
jgi:hypothetical protein